MGLHVPALRDPLVDAKTLPAASGPQPKTKDSRELVTYPEVQILAELLGAARSTGPASSRPLSQILSTKEVSPKAMLRLPAESDDDFPFVFTL